MCILITISWLLQVSKDINVVSVNIENYIDSTQPPIINIYPYLFTIYFSQPGLLMTCCVLAECLSDTSAPVRCVLVLI